MWMYETKKLRNTLLAGVSLSLWEKEDANIDTGYFRKVPVYFPKVTVYFPKVPAYFPKVSTNTISKVPSYHCH